MALTGGFNIQGFHIIGPMANQKLPNLKPHMKRIPTTCYTHISITNLHVRVDLRLDDRKWSDRELRLPPPSLIKGAIQNLEKLIHVICGGLNFTIAFPASWGMSLVRCQGKDS
jgi:hypothetical protein